MFIQIYIFKNMYLYVYIYIYLPTYVCGKYKLYINICM